MGEVRVPESAGLAAGTALLVSLSLSLMSGATLESTTLMNIHAAIASTSSMLFLGFVDDVLDIPWRLKLILPTLGTNSRIHARARRCACVCTRVEMHDMTRGCGREEFMAEEREQAIAMHDGKSPWL